MGEIDLVALQEQTARAREMMGFQQEDVLGSLSLARRVVEVPDTGANWYMQAAITLAAEYVAAARRSADLERERDEARDELAIANDFIGAVRSVCKEATGGNTTFVDDDAARLLARAKDSVIALNATTAALTAARARIAEMEEGA